MTPRSVLKYVMEGEIELAREIAEENMFDAVPIVKRGTICGVRGALGRTGITG